MSSQPSRRSFMVGAGAAGLGVTMPNLFTAAAKTSADPIQDCIDQCRNCEQVCLQTIQYCISAGGSHVEQGHVNALLDCATLCRTSAETMIRHSALIPMVCGTCAAACTSCAESCESFGSDNAMQACAAECRTCSESCQSMAA